jgi:putative flippase GtrA
MKRLPGTIRYGVVSGLCFALNITLVTALCRSGLHYAIAACLAFVAVGAFGFALHSHWTFKVQRSLASFGRYLSAMTLNLPLSILLIGIGHDIAGLSAWLSAMIASTILVGWNYIAVRWAIRQRSVMRQSPCVF